MKDVIDSRYNFIVKTVSYLLLNRILNRIPTRQPFFIPPYRSHYLGFTG